MKKMFKKIMISNFNYLKLMNKIKNINNKFHV